jgi:uncharacterized delta-60 repeat protein
MRTRAALLLTVSVLLVVAAQEAAASTPGSLDRSFGGDGKVLTNLSGHFDGANAISLQADNKIVAAGWAAGGAKFGLARYNPDGTLDPAFGGDGTVTTDVSDADDVIFGSAIQSDGKILVAGVTNQEAGAAGWGFTVARYGTDGTLDAAFGTGGIATIPLGDGDEATAVAVQPDGKIVVVGGASVVFGSEADFAVVRLDADGTPDTTFGDLGQVITDIDGSFDNATGGVVLQPDGGIVVGGVSVSLGTGASRFAVVRYQANGTPDPAWGGDGIVTTDFGPDVNPVFHMALQADGRIVAAGSTKYFAANPNVALARYATDGSLDTTFGGDGKVTIDVTGSHTEGAWGVDVDANGKIVAAGEAGGRDPRFLVVRMKTNGGLDRTFGGDGIVTTNFSSGEDGASAMVIQPNGRIVAAGFASTRNGAFALARYRAA